MFAMTFSKESKISNHAFLSIEYMSEKKVNLLTDRLTLWSTTIAFVYRVATVREKYLENEIFSKSGKSQGSLWMAREI